MNHSPYNETDMKDMKDMTEDYFTPIDDYLTPIDDRSVYENQHRKTTFPPNATPKDSDNNYYTHLRPSLVQHEQPPQTQSSGYPQLPFYPQPKQPCYSQQQPSQYFTSPQQQQQQQQPEQQQSSVTMINAGQPQVAMTTQPTMYQSFWGHITLACCVFWCCGYLFGFIAFILAMIASDKAGVGNWAGARQLGRASLGVSIAGIVVGCIIIAILVGIYVTDYNNRTINNSCSGAYYYCYSSDYGRSGCYCSSNSG